MGRKSTIEKMPVVNTGAAGIDVGGKSHFVSIGQRAEDVREFEAYTDDLHELAKWLMSMDIVTVAMESTGSYWQQLFSILQDYPSWCELVARIHCVIGNYNVNEIIVYD